MAPVPSKPRADAAKRFDECRFKIDVLRGAPRRAMGLVKACFKADNALMSDTSFAIRRAVPGDEPVVRALRLEALTEAPWAFGSSYERELARTDADWRRWFSPGVTFILEQGDQARGLVAGVRDQDDPLLVHLMAMWLHPDLRKTGGADALVSAVVAWAESEGARTITLDVIKTNVRAQRCYQRGGFQITGRECVGARTGVVEIEMSRAV